MKNTQKIISTSILLLVVFVFGYYVFKNISSLQQIFQIAFNWCNVLNIILIVFISIINFFLTGYLLDVLATSFSIHLKLKESFGLAMVTRFYNTITPFRGGMVARAIYLKKKHNFPYVHFLATLGAIYILIFMVGCLTGMASMVLIWSYNGLFNPLIFALFFITFIFLSGMMIFSPRLKDRDNKWVNRVIKIINGWNLIKNNKKVIVSTLVITVIQLILGVIIIQISYSIFGISLPFYKSLFLASINSISIMVSITPGNLGVGDAISVFSAVLIGVAINESIASTVLVRAITLVLTFILGPIFSYMLLRHNPLDIKRLETEKNETNT